MDYDTNSNIPIVNLDNVLYQLVNDLDERGMLDDTLVIAMGEFGRTPWLNEARGRDHYPNAWSLAMAGGGIQKGTVYGSSNATASEPEENALTVEDWAATIYNRIGIVADKELMAPGDRPIEIVDGGKVIQDLIV